MTLNEKSGETAAVKKLFILWPLFFLICLGLGYPAVRRYDPSVTPGLNDTLKYSAAVTGAEQSDYKEQFRVRVLVPYVARPFYRLAQRFLPESSAVFFGLLISASIFCATTACFIVMLGGRLFSEVEVGLIGALLYLLNFSISNYQLAGMVDAAEACFLVALVWSLLNKNWWWLPVWGLFGAAAKETFVLFASVFAFVWWLSEYRAERRRWKLFFWLALLALVGLITTTVIRTMVTGFFRWPWEIVERVKSEISPLASLRRCLVEGGFWYLFAWLLPLGFVRLKFFPRSWVTATLVTSLLAFGLGVYINSGGNFARAVFDISGPLLSLSVAALIAGKLPLPIITNSDYSNR